METETTKTEAQSVPPIRASAITVLVPQSVSELRDLATLLEGAQTLPDALKKKPADLMAIIMTGAELGLAPMQSIRTIVIIQGKPTLAAEAQVALVKRSPTCRYFKLMESTALKATFETLRAGDPSPTTISFTMEDAKRAGLVKSGGTYEKFPAVMLRWRAGSALAKAVYPDVTLGIPSTEEMEGVAEERDVTPEPVPPKTPTGKSDALRERLKKAATVDAKPSEKVPPPGIEFVRFGPHKGVLIADVASEDLEAAVKLANQQLANATGEEAWCASVHEGITAISVELDRREAEAKPAEPGSDQ